MRDSFWDWLQPLDVESVADSLGLPEEPMDREAVVEIVEHLKVLRPEQWRAWLLSDAHRLSIDHVASALRESTDRVSEFIRETRRILSAKTDDSE